MAKPYVCAKCGARFPEDLASGGSKCASCGASRGWRWLAVHEWFVLLAAVIAGVTAVINS